MYTPIARLPPIAEQLKKQDLRELTHVSFSSLGKFRTQSGRPALRKTPPLLELPE
jgi:hypothetical protein